MSASDEIFYEKKRIGHKIEDYKKYYEYKNQEESK